MRAGTGLKWHAYDPDVLPLWVAEMDLPPPDEVIAAVHEALVTGNTGYPHGDACASAMNQFTTQRWAWSFDPAHAIAVADVMGGIREVLALISDRGDPVIITPPVYGPFMDVIELADRTRIDAPLGPDDRLDLDAIDDAMAQAAARASRSGVLLLCSPHNPTGVVHTADELVRTAALARHHGVRVVVDEMHAPLVLPGVEFTPWLRVADTDPDVTLVSASKGFNLAALKAALAIGGSTARDDLARMPELVRHGPNHLGLVAHAAALTQATDWLDDIREAIADNHRLLAELVDEHLPGVTLRTPEATYLAWLDFTATGLGDNPSKIILQQGKVALSAGGFFGPGGAHHARLNVATSPELLREAVRRMAPVVADANPR